eukprot:9474944-Pyramimonas_sp.AAC.1
MLSLTRGASLRGSARTSCRGPRRGEASAPDAEGRSMLHAANAPPPLPPPPPPPSLFLLPPPHPHPPSSPTACLLWLHPLFSSLPA